VSFELLSSFGGVVRIIRCERKTILEPCAIEGLGFDYQFDTYAGCEHQCHYCYAQNRPELDWENEIGVIGNLRQKLSEELSRLPPQRIYIGMKTDPYQPAEQEYRQTREALEVLKEHDFSVSLLTKSSLVTRDMDLFKTMAGTAVGISVAFQDDEIRRQLEGNTMPKEERIRALGELKKNGIETYALICPVMPYLTDVEALIREVRPFADTIWVYPLEMKSEDDLNWKKTDSILRKHFPGKFEGFREAAFSSGHIYWKKLREKLEAIRLKDHLRMNVCF
jgi:DNA repair photolyase